MRFPIKLYFARCHPVQSHGYDAAWHHFNNKHFNCPPSEHNTLKHDTSSSFWGYTTICRLVVRFSSFAHCWHQFCLRAVVVSGWSLADSSVRGTGAEERKRRCWLQCPCRRSFCIVIIVYICCLCHNNENLCNLGQWFIGFTALSAVFGIVVCLDGRLGYRS